MMKTFRKTFYMILLLLFSVLLVGCDSVLGFIIPSPSPTPTPSPTLTFTPTFTLFPTLTFTSLAPSPSPTVTFFPTATITPEVFGTATFTVPPTDYVGAIKPIGSARFRGNFPGGNIVFSSNQDGDRVAGLQITVKCWGDDYVLNLSRVSMKLSNSTFTYGSEDVYVQGQFTSSSTAKGTFNYEITEGSKTCSYNYQGWTADMK